MLTVVVVLAMQVGLGVPSPEAIQRDSFGVPSIHAKTYREAFFDAGYAVAQDRLWQMELSRRSAEGQLAAIMGQSAEAADRETLLTSYSRDELERQFQRLSSKSREAIEAYVEGINTWIDHAKPNELSTDFARYQLKPSHWTHLDSVAITIHVLQIFGRGGAGELRNLAAVSYLRGQKAIGSRALDALDDIAWQNDPKSIPTVSPDDDPLLLSHYQFKDVDRKVTEAHLALVPKLGLLEILAGVKVSAREDSVRVAESLNIPFRTGSYCVALSSKRSSNHHPMLLGGPQLGMKAPSIVHEISMEAPGLAVVGMDIPGIPGVIIGHTPSFAWSITSGVADTDDIIFYPATDETYQYGKSKLPLTHIKFDLRIKGQSNKVIDQIRTIDGPVILTSKGTHSIFAKKSSYWMREMESYDCWTRLWESRTPASVERAMSAATMNFNFFYAHQNGDIGWRYLGLIPKRASGIDPRFPTPGSPQYGWRGFLRPTDMPHVRNPKCGSLTNWNNKPTTWWPNFDTPAWGEVFENSCLVDSIAKPQLSFADLEQVPEKIAQSDETWKFFRPYLAGTTLTGFDGRFINGSTDAALYRAFLDELRKVLFLKTTGSFLSPDYFKIVLQPSLVLHALQGKTRLDYLRGRSANEVVQLALQQAITNRVPPFQAGTFKTFDEQPVPYSNRGSTIQVTELASPSIRSESILPPGIAEFGPHQNDQSKLARYWQYKPLPKIRSKR